MVKRVITTRQGHRSFSWVLAGTVLLAACVVATSIGLVGGSERAFSQEGAEPVPRPPAEAIAAALETDDIIVIGESHSLSESGRLYRDLVHDSEFRKAVDDVVVEFGNARYQRTIDRYVAGRAVAPRRLRRVWRDTTQVGTWDAPMYAAFFRAVRKANRGATRTERLRVILADPPINWAKVTTFSQWDAYALDRERYMARVIRKEVLDRRRKAVVITGILHATRGDSELITLLDRWAPERIHVMRTHLGFPRMDWERRLYDWPVPSVAVLANTWIGNLPRQDGVASDAFDALLYLGNTSFLHLSTPLPTLYREDSYWNVLRKRYELIFRQPFDPDNLFGYTHSARYPESGVDEVELAKISDFSECMRTEGVESFPDPTAEFDFIGWQDQDLEVARSDPDFDRANETCSERHDFPAFPPDDL